MNEYFPTRPPPGPPPPHWLRGAAGHASFNNTRVLRLWADRVAGNDSDWALRAGLDFWLGEAEAGTASQGERFTLGDPLLTGRNHLPLSSFSGGGAGNARCRGSKGQEDLAHRATAGLQRCGGGRGGCTGMRSRGQQPAAAAAE